MVFTTNLFSQSLTNITCDLALPICGVTTQTLVESSACNTFWGAGNPPHLFYVFNKNTSNSALSMTILDNTTGGSNPTGLSYFKIYGPFTNSGVLDICSVMNSSLTAPILESSFSSNAGPFTPVQLEGTYILELIPRGCSGNISFNNVFDNDLVCQPNPPCENCVPSFSPKPGKYLLSAWVRQESHSITTTTFSNAKITISFTNSTVTYPVQASGQIIDGWQKMEKVFEIPSNATDIHLSFASLGGTIYYDDIRFIPFEGSMISYVYDPVTLRLMAELDERNYATLYEYDEEGKLIRVKKETEKGIMTIQENRDNSVKQ